jgi:4-alpha-glucanotransferase
LGTGDLGTTAHHFVDFLAHSQQHLWQMLPIGPPGRADSPYDAMSSFAGFPGLIGLDLLVRDGLLKSRDAPPDRLSSKHAAFHDSIPLKRAALRIAFENLQAHPRLRHAWRSYCEQESPWLDDWALFVALKKTDPSRSWTAWDIGIRTRREESLVEARRAFAEEIEFQQFLQFVFDRQWSKLRAFAKERGVHLVGDIPFYAAQESADVWSSPDLFDLNRNGRPRTVAGVPPDLFSRTGQLWGNPTYLWNRIEQGGYQWWIERIRAALRRFDAVRLDHLIGFHRSWCIPAGALTAQAGHWRPGPGIAIFDAIRRELGPAPLILEDLGLVTPAVIALREASGHPGMRILQWAWDGSDDSPHLPHNYPAACVAYSGTHDNTTLMGWYRPTRSRKERGSLDQIRLERERALRYANSDGREFHWDMIRVLVASRANTVIIPVQDLLGLGESARMNVPGTTRGNWIWRMDPTALTPDLARRLRDLTLLFGRGDK